ncbi:MAG: YcxB family protein [Candidatus Izemoplasmatales bacterium]|nr:YcxB family protein [Candidatus Izemoplasmatales bacterium]MDD5292801.1 YcxB family protein [Candidatus Izemoplasmatales bacterium]
MKISVDVTERDYYAFNEYQMTHTQHGLVAIRFQRMIMPIVSAIGIFILVFRGTEKSVIITTSVVLALVSLLWVIYTPKLIIKGLRYSLDRLKKEGKLPYSDKSEFDFTDDFIIETTENSVYKIKYAEVLKIAYANDCTYIYIGAAQAFIIPDRCIMAEKAELMNLLQEKIKM